MSVGNPVATTPKQLTVDNIHRCGVVHQSLRELATAATRLGQEATVLALGLLKTQSLTLLACPSSVVSAAQQLVDQLDAIRTQLQHKIAQNLIDTMTEDSVLKLHRDDWPVFLAKKNRYALASYTTGGKASESNGGTELEYDTSGTSKPFGFKEFDKWVKSRCVNSRDSSPRVYRSHSRSPSRRRRGGTRRSTELDSYPHLALSAMRADVGRPVLVHHHSKNAPQFGTIAAPDRRYVSVAQQRRGYLLVRMAGTGRLVRTRSVRLLTDVFPDTQLNGALAGGANQKGCTTRNERGPCGKAYSCQGAPGHLKCQRRKHRYGGRHS